MTVNTSQKCPCVHIWVNSQNRQLTGFDLYSYLPLKFSYSTTCRRVSDIIYKINFCHHQVRFMANCEVIIYAFSRLPVALLIISVKKSNKLKTKIKKEKLMTNILGVKLMMDRVSNIP